MDFWFIPAAVFSTMVKICKTDFKISQSKRLGEINEGSGVKAHTAEVTGDDWGLM